MVPDDFQPGHVLAHGDLNAILAELRRLGKVKAVPPLFVSDDASGFRLELGEMDHFSIKILAGGSGGAYPWREQIPAPAGTWTDGPRSGTLANDPAYEASSNASVATGTVILRARRDRGTSQLVFERACT